MDKCSFYSLVVDYSRSVVDGIRAGCYDYTNPDIAACHFPTEKSGVHEVTVELLCLDTDALNVLTEEVQAEMETRGLRLADFHELLAFGEKHPEIQREFPIVALGSAWQCRDNRRLVPFLDRYGAGRRLDLYWIEYGWNGVCRFLAVRK